MYKTGKLVFGQMWVDFGDGTALVMGKCVVTGEPFSVEVPSFGLHQWLEGKTLIQDALPNTSPEEREFLITGTSPKGWKELFGDE